MLSNRPALTLACVAALLLAPSLILGTLPSHSAAQNLTWAAQFAEQFRAGVLYPRWMPESFDGLGGPALYFYPPLAFWLDGVLSLVTFNLLSVSHRLTLDELLLLWASGLAMHAWLSAETGRARVALWGALAYMAAPYHLLVDHYIRGAFAEGAAYVFLPLVMLGIRQVTDRRPYAPLLLALAYGGLLMSHLPTALLVSTTVLPAYALFCARGLAKLLCVTASGLLGIGLAAIYLWPAITLQGWIAADLLWTRFYRVDNWFLLTPGRWPQPILMQIVASITAAALILALGLCVLSRRRAEALFWPAASVVGIALLSGIVPWFWQLPELAKVQFPWRLLVAVEFALITALCFAPLAPLRRAKVYLGAASMVALAPGVLLGMGAGAAAVSLALSHVEVTAQDVKEYEPRGFPIAPSLTYAELGLEPVKDVPLVSCEPAAALCRATPERFGTMRLEIDSQMPTRVTARRFYFPAWQPAGAGMPIEPTEKYRLVSFAAPAGRTTVQLQRAALPEEKWGWAVSGASLLLLLAMAAFTARSSSR